MARYALLIAVENYVAKDIKPVRYASADATKLAETFTALGFDRVDVLIDVEATKTSIEFQVKRAADRLKPNDHFFLFFAGHGIAENDHNYLVCHDSQRGGLAATSVRLQWIYDVLKKSNCKHCALFLDACHSGIEIDEAMRSIISDFSDDELESFVASADFCVCFAACRSDQRSFSLTRLGHGVWSHCLIEALSGRARGAVERKRLVTATSLQAYLRDEVPRELRKDRPNDTQTPWVAGGFSSDFLVADVGDLIAAQRKPNPFSADHLRRVAFRAEESGKIKSLSGFEKRHHFVPKTVNDWGTGFVQNISSSDLEADLNQMHARIKDALGYRRRDMTKHEVVEGAGSIETPDFHYTINVSQHPTKAEEYLIKREISNIKNMDVVMSDSFNVVFAGFFDTLEFEYAKKIDLEALIDHCEAEEISVDYDADASYCEIVLDEHPARIVVRARSVEFVHSSPKEPRMLASTFQTFLALAAGHNLKMLTA